jgi:hypothetical protein
LPGRRLIPDMVLEDRGFDRRTDSNRTYTARPQGDICLSHG